MSAARGPIKVRLLQRIRQREHPDIDDPRVQRSCIQKKKYRSKVLARDAASRATKKYEVEARFYYCLHCRQFHLTTVRAVSVPEPEVEIEHPSAPERLLQSLVNTKIKRLVRRNRWTK